LDRRAFIKLGGTGMMTLLLSGCGIGALGSNDKAAPDNKEPQKAANVAQAAPGGGMKIVVVTGSPHRAGTSALLADKFIEGAKAAGHDVFRFNAAFEEIHPCLGCGQCGMSGPCVQKDAIEQKLIERLTSCDMIVLVTPLYYYGFSAQIKTVIDRFYSRTGAIHNKKAALMATSWNGNPDAMDELMEHYRTLCRYMEWNDAGTVLGIGCGGRADIERSEFPEMAYKIGLNLRA